MLSLTLFGTLGIAVDGVPIRGTRTRKGEWLLALLALRQGRAVDRAWLASVLWPGSDEPQARYNLRRALSDLKGALGAASDAVAAPSARTLALDPSAEVDVQRFDRAAGLGTAEGRRAAIAAYAGPLLEECADDWVMDERSAREQAFLALLEAEAAACTEPQAAARLLRRSIAVDPLRESAYRALMKALALDGDIAAVKVLYRDLRERLHREVNAAPDPATVAVFEEISRAASPAAGTGHAAPPPPRALHAPVAPAGMVGRRAESAAVIGLLERSRLVTLLGPGGIGKTRLALHVLETLAPSFGGGAWFVDLTTVERGEDLARTVALALRVRAEPSEPPLDAIAAHLSGRRALIVLDNFEQVVGGGSVQVATILGSAPAVRVLVTSRVVLGVSGEQQYPVPPLAGVSGTGTPEEMLACDRVRLFVDRAQAVQPYFQLSTSNAGAIAAISAKLEGVPLAIELAAARAAVLSPEQILRQLDDRLTFLRSNRRDIPERHRTVRGAIEAGFVRLEPAVQRFFAGLSVFRGGWTLDAAAAVLDEPRTLEFLEQLRDASMVLVEPTDTGDIRFRMLETLREFAGERLTAAAARRLIRRHRDYYTTVIEAAGDGLVGPAHQASLDIFEAEHDNVRIVLTRCLSGGPSDARAAFEIVEKVMPFWRMRGYSAEGYKWVERMLEHPLGAERGRSRAVLLTYRSNPGWQKGSLAEASAMLEEAVAIAEDLGDQLVLTRALSSLGAVERSRGNLELSLLHGLRATEIARARCSRAAFGDACRNLGLTQELAGDYAGARVSHEAALAVDREVGDAALEAGSLLNLALVLVREGSVFEAWETFESALEVYRNLGDMPGICLACLDSGEALLALGRDAEAAARLNEAEQMFRELGWRQGLAGTLVLLAEVHLRMGDHDAALGRLRESWSVAVESQAAVVKAEVVAQLASMSRRLEQWRTVTRLHAAAAASREAMGVRLAAPDAARIDRDLEACRTALGEEEFQQEWAAGLETSVEEASALGFAEGAASGPAA